MKIKAIAKAIGASARTLYNYRAGTQSISNDKAARLRAFINRFQAADYLSANE